LDVTEGNRCFEDEGRLRTIGIGETFEHLLFNVLKTRQLFCGDRFFFFDMFVAAAPQEAVHHLVAQPP
jgi:hypothetical protein